MVTTAADPATPQADDRYVGYLPLSEIKRAPHNPKKHAEARIKSSISRFGLGELPLLDERTGRLVAGHGRLDQVAAAMAAGEDPPEGVRVGPDGEWTMPVIRGWRSRSDADAEAYLTASNRLTELGGWDEQGLADMLTRLNDTDAELLELAGYTDTEYRDLLADLGNPHDFGGPDPDTEPGEAGEPGDGSLLGLTDVTITEPSHRVETGQVWQLGNRHLLVVASVHTDHPLWRPYLGPDTVFLPYPGPYVALSTKADDRPLLLVHPDPYMAGHVLDKYTGVHGKAAAVLIDGPGATQ